MSNKDNNKENKKRKDIKISYLALGTGLGLLFGAVVESISTGAGMVLGAAIGVIITSSNKLA